MGEKEKIEQGLADGTEAENELGIRFAAIDPDGDSIASALGSRKTPWEKVGRAVFPLKEKNSKVIPSNRTA